MACRRWTVSRRCCPGAILSPSIVPERGDAALLINARTLALMKPGAYLINTARGTIVDEAALITFHAESERRRGRRSSMIEPPRPGNPLLHMENVIVTPHFCAMTEESLYNIRLPDLKGN